MYFVCERVFCGQFEPSGRPMSVDLHFSPLVYFSVSAVWHMTSDCALSGHCKSSLKMSQLLEGSKVKL